MKVFFHSSFVFVLSKAFINILRINLIKQGDKSKVSNLKNAKALLDWAESIIKFIISFNCDNFVLIVGFITFRDPLYCSFIIFKCSSQHISLYLFLS